jgi:hypothetical protein
MNSPSVHLPEKIKGEKSRRFLRWCCGYLFTKAEKIAMF